MNATPITFELSALYFWGIRRQSGFPLIVSPPEKNTGKLNFLGQVFIEMKDASNTFRVINLLLLHAYVKFLLVLMKSVS